MHLVLRSDSGESITLEVLQEDTFEDLANRLYERGKISVDLKQLRTDSRPFEMTANVMDYFGAKKGIRRKESQEKNTLAAESPTSTTGGDLNSASDNTVANVSLSTIIPNDSSVDTVSSISNLDASVNNSIKTGAFSHSVNTINHTDNSEPSLESQMNLLHQDLVNVTKNSVSCEDLSILQTVKYCRLCACPINEGAKFIFESSNSEENADSVDTLADKINESLPILVSKEDELPKQVCPNCVESLNASHAFTKRVTAADDLLKKLLYRKSFEIESTGEEERCPLCCEGSMKVMPVEELPLKEEISPDSNEEDYIDQPWGNGDLDADEFDEYDDDENSFSQPKRRGRPRGSRTSKRQYPWDDLDDEDWTLKEETVVKKRGRPKGSKNKSSQQEQPTQCSLCLTWHSDVQAVLAHTLEVHCEDETGTFPCPLCKAIQPDEGELIHHVTNHNQLQPPVKVKMWGCPLCGQVYEGQEEIGNHLLSDHVQAASPQYQCPLCDHAPTSGSRLANHITDSHCGPPTWNCPLCDEGHEGKQSALDHVVRSHVSMAAQTTQCPLCEMQFITDDEMAQHLLDRHTTTHVVERPAHYTCSACNSRFKSQYNLVKHTCPAVDNSQFCIECNMSFPSKMRHVFHLQFHQEGVNVLLRCDLCLAEFDDETNLYDHIRFHHETDKQLSCNFCNQTFKTDVDLSRHIQKHHFRVRQHECEECGAKFLNAQTLKEHSVSHMVVKPFQCYICGAQLSRLSRLRLHLRNHSVQESSGLPQTCYQCSQCLQLFPSEQLTIKHCTQEHNQENVFIKPAEVILLYRCEFCDGCFSQSEELNDHRKTNHSDPNIFNAYTCRVCGSAFPSYAQVTTHKLSHGLNTEKLILHSDEDKPSLSDEFTIPQYFLCEVCGKKCLHYTYLSMHRKLSHPSQQKNSLKECDVNGANNFEENGKSKLEPGDELDQREKRERKMRCPVCKRRYSSEETLEAHMRVKHSSGIPTAKPYMCETCGKTFAFKSAWQAHCDAHNGLKQYGCSECDKRFTHRAGLMKHLRLHSTDRPYLCEFCGKKFRDCTERNNHVRAHTGERPFMCEVCGRAFHTRAVLLDHSRIHRNERPYPCDICGLAFRRSFALKSHKLIHTGQKPFQCPDCGRSFRLKQTLAAHQKKEHQESLGSNSIEREPPTIFILEETEYETVDDEDERSELQVKDSQTFINVTKVI